MQTNSVDTFTSCDIFYFTVSGLWGIIITLLGLVGNSLAFTVLYAVGRNSVIFFILKALAVVDSIFIATYFLTRVIPHLMDSLSSPKIYGPIQYVIYAIFPLMSWALTASLWLTCLLTIHRYIAICKAFSACQWSNMLQVKFHVGVLLTVGGLLEIVRYFDYEVIQDVTPNGEPYTYLLPTELYEDPLYQLFYRNILMTGLRTMLPIVISTILTGCIIQSFLKLSKKNCQLYPFPLNVPQKLNNSMKNEKRVTRTLLRISMLMVILKTPIAIYPIFYATLNVGNDPCGHFYHYFATVAETLAAFNSALNFYNLYPSMPTVRTECQRIRTLLIECLHCRRKRLNTVAEELSVRTIDIIN